MYAWLQLSPKAAGMLVQEQGPDSPNFKGGDAALLGKS